MKKGILLIILYLFISDIKGQADTVARINLISGSSVYFAFNSLEKMDPLTGIVYNNWTTFSVSFNATNDLGNDTGALWRLRVRSNTSNIIGSGSNTLDTRTVEVSANSAGQGSDAGWIPLVDSDVTIVDAGTNLITDEPIVISYRCGRNATYPILGENGDYYVVDLVFTFELIP